jgi:hypothetical protein
MKTAVMTTVSAALVSLLMSAAPARALDGDRLSAADREAIIAGVISHFKEHPEQLVEAIMGWRSRSGSDLISPADPVSGNAEGDITIIEFADMGCAPCRTMSARIAAISEADKGIRVVHKDYPVSGPDSVFAARQLLTAAYTDGNRDELAKALLSAAGFDRKSIEKAASAAIVGPVTQIVTDRVNQSLERTRKLAAGLGIKELPAVILVSGSETKVMTGLQTDASIAASVSSLRKQRQADR